jgi:hypothetical protein
MQYGGAVAAPPHFRFGRQMLGPLGLHLFDHLIGAGAGGWIGS